MCAKRHLIVNADDFGQSPGVNRGIITAHERGIVTSASLMVRWPAAREAAAYGRAQPRLSLGLHIDLGEWVCRSGAWEPLYEVVAPDDMAAVAQEVSRQLDAFRRLVGRDPTHLDSHQHAHQREPARAVTLDLARRLRVPLRGCDPAIHYCGGFYGQSADGSPSPEVLSTEGLIRILAELPPGVIELGCHPGEGDDLDTMYRAERAREVEVLCNKRVRAALAELNIELHSFASISQTASARAR
jgi:predicted glycoside hydrolase/deacetylase ChbG (UPF0249 family)